MKNTTFRKKALLSSVAMLLVALVALGSATFAWFTQNPTVTANGLSLKATAAAGLQILSGTEKTLGGEYGTTTTLRAETLGVTNDEDFPITAPVSLDCSATGINFYNATADNENEYKMATTPNITPGFVGYSEEIYLRASIPSNDAIAVKAAKVSVERTSVTDDLANLIWPALRITLVDTKDNTVIGTWSPSGATNGYINASGLVMNGEQKALTTNMKAFATSVQMNKEVKYTTGTDYSVMMYVWLDGEDEACKTANVENLKQLVKSVTVKFSTNDTIVD